MDYKLIYKAVKMGPFKDLIIDDLFVDREEIAWKLFNIADLTSRRLAMSTVFSSQRRLGKTELLKRLYNVLFWTQEEVVPIYYYMKVEHLDRMRFSREYFKNFLVQYLAFKNKDPSILEMDFLMEDLIELAQKSKDDFLVKYTKNMLKCIDEGDHNASMNNAVYAPTRFAGKTNKPILVMFDEFQRVEEMTLSGKPDPAGGAFGEVVESNIAPHIVSGSSMSLLNKTLALDCFFMRFDRLKLEPLDDAYVLELINRFSAFYKVKVSDATKSMIIGKCKGNPFYIKCIFRQANMQKSNLETKEELDNILSIELSYGLIWHDWDEHLKGYIPEKKLDLARRVLYYALKCKNESGEIQEGKLAEYLNTDLEEVNNILKQFYYGDFFKQINGYYAEIEDPFLHKYIISQYRLLVEKESLDDVQKQVSDDLKSEIGYYTSVIGIIFEKCIEDLLKKWTDKDYIPKIFFEYEKFKKLSPEELKKEIEKPSQVIRLAKMAYIKKNYIIQVKEGEYAKEIDIYGAGSQYDTKLVEDEYEEYEVTDVHSVTWLIDLRFRKEKTNQKHLKGFLKKTQTIQKKLRREKNEKIEIWAVSKSGFTKEAVEFAKKNNLYLSNLEQLNLLFKYFDLGEIMEWAVKETNTSLKEDD